MDKGLKKQKRWSGKCQRDKDRDLEANAATCFK